MIGEGKTLREIARARKEAREAAEQFNEGTFKPDDMPDIVIDKRPNVAAFMSDPESYRLRAIEDYNEDTGEASKTDVFHENILAREKTPEINSIGDAVLHVLDPSREQLHRQRAYYLANVTMIDEKIGQILQRLEAQGYLDNAVVVFTSDHGDCLSNHGLSQKWSMYEAVTRVPMIFWAPGRVKAGSTYEGLCQLMDLSSTFLELAGLPIPETFEARSLAPLLQGETVEPPGYAFCEQGADKDNPTPGTDFITMVRSPEWKLVHFLGETSGQLFDLENDPQENTNLWDDGSHSEEKSRLLEVLREWRIRSGMHTKDWAASLR